MSSVTVEDFPGYPAIFVTWEHIIRTEDLRPAFRQMVAALQSSPTPIYIVMDLLQNPRFPVVATMTEALVGPFRHPKLAEWLVIGGNPDARWIGNMLSKITRRQNIVWFNSKDEVLVYLDKLAQK